MKYIRAKAGFIRYTDEKLLVRAAHIIKCMQSSTVFTQPRPVLCEIEKAYAEYSDLVIAAVGGSRIIKAQRRESMKVLCVLLQELVNYVNEVSDGNLPKLYSSGFPVLAKKRKGTAPDVPANPFVCDGRVSGEVAFGFQPVGRDMIYEYCFATQVDQQYEPIWGEIEMRTKSFKAYKSGFLPGKYIFFKVRATNGHGSSAWTTPIKFLVR
ncbi:hypothetical protein [Sphingobacterium wenxiniae]|uniref:Fibronectin type-III domain-containing protein n=1 Tax=Sphingobacterium wenxiniae TaxID=683125 RepID=A0A1I6VE40_9SPHI|nr:hypothetical protein [Sphingobacterium wenxiniae]SFT11976.1 hypothetical protein SAMN05660206_11329 [Sphingobacterium wenxiniae]